MRLSKQYNQYNQSKAFTIIELVVSIVVIGILTSIVFISYPGIKKQMTISQMNADLRNAATQLSRDLEKKGKFPDTKEESGDGKGLTASSGTVLSYEYNSAVNTYCLSATNSGVSYYIDAKTKTVTYGACPAAMTFAVAWGGADGEYADSMAVTNDGGQIIVGSTYSYSSGGDSDAFLAKYDSSGNLSWSKTWGGIDDDDASFVIQTNDGGYAMVGQTYSFGVVDRDAFLAKYDSLGNLSWSRTWGGADSDQASSVVQVSDGSYVITGNTYSYGAGTWDVFLAKYDSSGNLSWDRTLGSIYNEGGPSIAKADDGGCVISGSTGGHASGDDDVYLAKYDSSGNLSWSKTWGGINSDNAQSIARTSDGGYIITGQTFSFGAGDSDAILAKYDSLGNLSWNKTWGGVGHEFPQSIIQLFDGSYVLSGATDSFGAGGDDAFLAKFDQAGNLLWNKTWGGVNNEDAASVAQAADGSFIIAGGTSSYGSGADDAFLVKFKSDGMINNCSAPMCQSPLFTTTNPIINADNPPNTITNPTATLMSPSATTSSPVATNTIIIAPM